MSLIQNDVKHNTSLYVVIFMYVSNNNTKPNQFIEFAC